MKEFAPQPRCFLATTALEEFWDLSTSAVFLGKWCLRHSRSSVWEERVEAIVPDPWADREALAAAHGHVECTYERFLDQLTPILNEIHNVEFGERYWRILIGPWLYWYISVCYDRYRVVQSALSQFPHFTTIGLAKNSYVVPRDT